jgi:hypothetical protein
MSTAELPVEISDEPLVGWRCWFVLPEEGLLRPIFKRGLVWKPREAIQALCPEHLHEIPDEDCKCGVWTVCHPMLLDEIGWTSAPPQGIGKLPGVMVVGEVSLWGKILQHERGWRASSAYPRHLYAFTEDALLAETLRERYGVPVEWGPDAERLRRLLPASAAEAEKKEPELREVLLDVLRTGLCPKELDTLVLLMLVEWADVIDTSAAERLKRARKDLDQAPASPDRVGALGRVACAAADLRALAGDRLAARRVLWVRLGRWQRNRAEEIVGLLLDTRDGLLEDLARGTSRHPTGRPYAAATVKIKSAELERADQDIDDLVPKIEALMAVPVPTYREWCALARGVVLGSSPGAASEEDLREWTRQSMRREGELARREHDVVLARHANLVDRETFERELAADREALEQERSSLRDDVIAEIQRDRAALLDEIGDLERRRRALLAMMPRPSAKMMTGAEPLPGGLPLKMLLRAAGISQGDVARAAGVKRSVVCRMLGGHRNMPRVREIAERLLARARGAAAW